MIRGVAGFDISTKEITMAIVNFDEPALGDPPAIFRVETIAKTTDDGVFYRDIRNAVRHLCTVAEIVLAYVEKPRGPFAVRQLNGVYGAVMASIPRHIARAGIEPLEWRRELGLPRKFPKGDAIREAENWIAGHGWVPEHVDEHKADALFVALAGRQLNNRHFHAA